MRHLATRSRREIPFADNLIAAGAAVEIGETHTLLDVNALITRGRDGFIAFEVTGDSMVGHIHAGNIIFVDTWAEARNGDVVAATVAGLTCVKIFQQTHRGLYLVSANKDYKPREITAQDSFAVLGVVRGHLALYS